MEKEIKITPPEGFEIDKENSTFECIKFKPIEKRWGDNENVIIRGYYINNSSEIISTKCYNIPANRNVFATKEQAKSALAMARISQIMANDKRFGGPITDEEWKNGNGIKYVIIKESNHISNAIYYFCYHFLAFHTGAQRDLFLRENEDLVKDYLMIS